MKLETDFELWPEWNALLDLMAGRWPSGLSLEKVMVRVWQQLALNARAGMVPTGWMPPGALRRCGDWMTDDLVNALKTGDVPLLCERSLDGRTYLVCERFARLNPELDRGYKPASLKASEHAALSRRVLAAEKAAGQLSLGLPADGFKDADGKTLSADVCAECVKLIRGLDVAFGAPERPVDAIGFPPALLAGAALAVTRMTAEELKALKKRVFEMRGHPAVPACTDALLQVARDDAGKVWRLPGIEKLGVGGKR